MLELIIHPGPKTQAIESPIPVPNDDQVVIKVIVSGSNPKDWKRPEWSDVHINQGDDIAGIVHAVGKNVSEFKPGDRVAAFHEIMQPGGSYAEYALAWASTTFHIPQKTWFEGDIIVDYRLGADSLVDQIQSFLRKHNFEKLQHVFDAVCDHGSLKNILHVLDQEHGIVACVLPQADYQLSSLSPGVKLLQTNVRSVHGQPGSFPGDPDFGFVYFRYFSRGLTEGWFSGHPYEVRENGLDGVEGALRDLKEGKASAVKYVFRVEDTPALKK
ncbi:hypothetical protein UA08_09330 [Talaromyces atroroseus]|uniref:Alcohol dehydrogenase-like N-terminal domain-containing protein n=1 Tax=Talaromyces atroroseus TaxID=1441469 RepID=A0A1Q5Q6Q0_TALAT|nr:hypothetical protein UA08_09330 [Talaromyces atroroseus]OKL55420.1 hypothetical protein UA08_09330 [Talaromyces atroroseus]